MNTIDTIVIVKDRKIIGQYTTTKVTDGKRILSEYFQNQQKYREQKNLKGYRHVGGDASLVFLVFLVFVLFFVASLVTCTSKSKKNNNTLNINKYLLCVSADTFLIFFNTFLLLGNLILCIGEAILSEGKSTASCQMISFSGRLFKGTSKTNNTINKTKK